MKTPEWKIYRTRFLVKAKQLTSNLTFTDELGRQHSGRKGDYLVESPEGNPRIAPRQIFEDIYVSMSAAEIENADGARGHQNAIRDAEVRRKQPQSFRGRIASQGAGNC